MQLDDIERRLRVHQREPFRHLQKIFMCPSSHGLAAIDASDTGTGKTYVAAGLLRSLATSALVVGPKISERAWRSAANHFDDTLSFVGYEAVRGGKTKFGQWERIIPPRHEWKCVICQCTLADLYNCQPCQAHSKGIHCVKKKTIPGKYINFQWHPAINFLVFDEAHRLSGDSVQSDLLEAALNQKIPTLLLTATPGFSPLQLNSIGRALGLHSGGSDFYRWSSRYGCRKHPAFRGWTWLVGKERQREVMNDIGRNIFPARGVRVRVDDIPGFPEFQVEPTLYDLDEVDKINGLYAQMADSLASLAERAEACRSGSETIQAGDDLAVTSLLRDRQRIELLKVPLAVEIANDYVAKGSSVAIFANFSQTLAEIRSRLGLLGCVDGKTIGKPRDLLIDRFQSNEDRILALQCGAGGISVSLHDLTGDFPRVGLIFPGFSAVEFIQILGRLRRLDGKSRAFYRVLLAAGTPDEKVWRALTQKKENLVSLLTDRDLIPV